VGERERRQELFDFSPSCGLRRVSKNIHYQHYSSPVSLLLRPPPSPKVILAQIYTNLDRNEASVFGKGKKEKEWYDLQNTEL
jgi:hypothetical protein